MKGIHIKSLILTAIFIASIGALQAQPFGNGPHGMRGGCNMLDLNDDQEKKIDELHTAHAKEMLPIRNQLNEKHARLQTLRTANKYDAGAVNKTLEEINELQLKMAKTREAHHQQIRNLLTDEQRVKFDMHSGREHHKRGYEGQAGSPGKKFNGDCPYGNDKPQRRNGPKNK